MSRTERLIENIARAWTDQEPVDWQAAEREGGLTAVQLEQLRALDEMTLALRRVLRDARDNGAADMLFRWGPLEVRRRIGAGVQAEIYEAWDPLLAQAVALKLFRGDAVHGSSIAQQLREVRALAKVRHRNVVSVFGAAEHDGRFGIWTELVEGRTLEQQLADDGPFAIDDALAVGRDVLRALIAVHAQGFVHGDVKTSNVLRERGGRIVLADFGACRLHEEGNQLASIPGSPHYLPPEALRGEDAGVGGDVYAAAVLLYRLLGGRYPHAGETAEELVRAVQTAQPQPLASARSDVPEALSRLLARALAPERSARLSDAAQLLEELGDLARARHPPAQSRRIRTALVAGVLLAAGLATAAWFREQYAPSAAGVDLAFARESGAQLETLGAGAVLRTGDLLGARLALARPAFVYIFNEDDGGQVSVLFPLRGLDLQNPLPAQSLELPGLRNGQPYRWRVSSASASEEFLVVIAPHAVSELDAMRERAVQPEVLPDDDRQRGVAALQARALALPHFDGRGLEALAAELSRRADAGDLRISRFAFPQRD